MKRIGALGSVLTTAVVATVFFRGPAPGQDASTQPNRTPSSGSALPAEDNPRKAQKKELPEDGPWKASRQHFAGTESGKECPPSLAPAGSLTQTPARGNRREDLWCIPTDQNKDDDTVQAMIAIVPDPIHTHMPLVFDRTVEAIQLAADKMHFVIDQYWLPWDSEPSPQWMDYDSRQKATLHEQKKQEQPGLLMFRWNGDIHAKTEDRNQTNAGQEQSTARVLYVFLVSDTSTSGINGMQFSNAVDYVEDVLCVKPRSSLPRCEKSSAIRIMGPSFSGSLASLRKLAGQRKPQAFTVYSGTVSSGTAIRNQHFDELSPPLTFHPFVNDAETSIEKFLAFLRDSHDIQCEKPTEVAILSEAATTYGSAPRGPDTSTATPKQHCPYTTFSYPREISSLRNAYQRGDSTANSGGKSGPYLALNLADSTNSSDEPPDFSKQQGPLSKEAVLMQFAAEMRRDQYKYIGIAGSNVLDVMFLTDFLRKACPDTRLFVIDSDLLFERELDNAPYLGMLAVSTYPLIGPNLDWTSPDRRLPRLPFSDQFEEAQYNATLKTIQEMLYDGADAGIQEYREPFPPDPGEKFNPQSPKLPLWLTAVGTSGYWPVQILSHNTNPSRPGLQPEDFSVAWKAILVLLLALTCLHIAILITASPMSARFRDFAVVSVVPMEWLFFIHTASAALALALAMMTAPAWGFGAGFAIRAIAWVSPIAIICLLLTCGLLHWNYLLRRPWESKMHGTSLETPGGRRATLWTVACIGVWIIAIVLGILWQMLFTFDPSHYGFFFAYRTIHLATGVAPFTPVLPLLAAVYVWSIFEIWRLRFNNRVRPRLTVDFPLPGWETENRIANAVNKYLLSPGYSATFAIVFALWLAFFNPVHPFQLFEHWEFAMIYEVLFCTVVALMLSSGFRLAQIWAELRLLLRELERSPIRLAFCRLKGFSWSPIWRPGGAADEWINMARSFEALQQIANCKNAPDLELNEFIAATKTKAGKVLDIRKQMQRASLSLSLLRTTSEYRQSAKIGENEQTASGLIYKFQTSFYEIQEDLGILLNRVLQVLQKAWSTRCSEMVEGEELERGSGQVVVHCKEEKIDVEAQQTRRLEEYAALRYVAFIRGTLGHIRHLLIFLGISFSLVLISLNVYSFEPHQSLIWSFTAIFAAMGFTVVMVLMQVHKDYVLSRITGTTPDELGIAFYFRIISFGAAPLLTLLATHFPSIGRYLLSFLQPGLEALK